MARARRLHGVWDVARGIARRQVAAGRSVGEVLSVLLDQFGGQQHARLREIVQDEHRSRQLVDHILRYPLTAIASPRSLAGCDPARGRVRVTITFHWRPEVMGAKDHFSHTVEMSGRGQAARLIFDAMESVREEGLRKNYPIPNLGATHRQGDERYEVVHAECF